VVATDVKTSAINAALANGMFGHADETDDFEPVTKAHPGCAVLPAALAVGEREGRSGTEFLRAVVLGYDLCCRFLLALGPDHVRGTHRTHRSAEGTSSTFGSVGAAAALARLDERQTRYALSYAAQQVSGIWSWARDTEHVEKAFDFAGMGARTGVTAALMAQANLQYALAVMLIDGDMSFTDSHSHERMKDPAVRAVMERVQLVADASLVGGDAPRSGHVEVTLRDGRRVEHFTRHPPGTKENPLPEERVNAKARSLMAPVLGAAKTEELIKRVHAIEQVGNVRDLIPLLVA
jgi:2-methylcitrate dehydratase PrpD